jgi:hypothetical protein
MEAVGYAKSFLVCLIGNGGCTAVIKRISYGRFASVEDDLTILQFALNCSDPFVSQPPP